MRDYRKIDAWRLADDLVLEIYRVSQSFPQDELYGLTRQIRRAAVSVPANIAEGSARGTNKDYLHFLCIARASLTETQYFIHLASRLGFLSAAGKPLVEEHLRRTFACLHGLIEAVQNQVP